MTTDDKDLVLLPCPFCGEGAAFGAIVDGSKNGRPFVNCVMCQASNGESLGFSNLEDAAEAWNTRREAADRIEQLSSANAELQRIIGWCRRRLSSPSLEKYVDEMLAALKAHTEEKAGE